MSRLLLITLLLLALPIPRASAEKAQGSLQVVVVPDPLGITDPHTNPNYISRFLGSRLFPIQVEISNDRKTERRLTLLVGGADDDQSFTIEKSVILKSGETKRISLAIPKSNLRLKSFYRPLQVVIREGNRVLYRESVFFQLPNDRNIYSLLITDDEGTSGENVPRITLPVNRANHLQISFEKNLEEIPGMVIPEWFFQFDSALSPIAPRDLPENLTLLDDIYSIVISYQTFLSLPEKQRDALKRYWETGGRVTIIGVPHSNSTGEDKVSIRDQELSSKERTEEDQGGSKYDSGPGPLSPGDEEELKPFFYGYLRRISGDERDAANRIVLDIENELKSFTSIMQSLGVIEPVRVPGAYSFLLMSREEAEKRLLPVNNPVRLYEAFYWLNRYTMFQDRLILSSLSDSPAALHLTTIGEDVAEIVKALTLLPLLGLLLIAAGALSGFPRRQAAFTARIPDGIYAGTLLLLFSALILPLAPFGGKIRAKNFTTLIADSSSTSSLVYNTLFIHSSRVQDVRIAFDGEDSFADLSNVEIKGEFVMRRRERARIYSRSRSSFDRTLIERDRGPNSREPVDRHLYEISKNEIKTIIGEGGTGYSVKLFTGFPRILNTASVHNLQVNILVRRNGSDSYLVENRSPYHLKYIRLFDRDRFGTILGLPAGGKAAIEMLWPSKQVPTLEPIRENTDQDRFRADLRSLPEYQAEDILLGERIVNSLTKPFVLPKDTVVLFGYLLDFDPGIAVDGMSIAGKSIAALHFISHVDPDSEDLNGRAGG